MCSDMELHASLETLPLGLTDWHKEPDFHKLLDHLKREARVLAEHEKQLNGLQAARQSLWQKAGVLDRKAQDLAQKNRQLNERLNDLIAEGRTIVGLRSQLEEQSLAVGELAGVLELLLRLRKANHQLTSPQDDALLAVAIEKVEKITNYYGGINE